MKTARRTSRRSSGFSLVELTVTIAITGIVAVGLSGLIRHPIEGRAAVARRAELVALGDVALDRLVEDIEAALPRSLRVGAGGSALELMRAQAAGRYRAAAGVNDAGGSAEQDHSATDDWLTLSADTSFNVLGRITPRPVAYGSSFASGTRVAIGADSANTLWRDAARSRNPGAITPAGTGISLVDDADEDQLRLTSDHTFRAASPNGRFYLVDAPISWICDGRDASIWRVEGYAMQRRQPTNRRRAPLSSQPQARAAEFVESCRFAYVPGPADRGGLVTIELVLETNDERVRLARSVAVRHAP